jgi:hypothetical protein
VINKKGAKQWTKLIQGSSAAEALDFNEQGMKFMSVSVARGRVH